MLTKEQLEKITDIDIRNSIVSMTESLIQKDTKISELDGKMNTLKEANDKLVKANTDLILRMPTASQPVQSTTGVSDKKVDVDTIIQAFKNDK